MSVEAVTYTEFAHTAVPWLPDQPFTEQNAAAIGDVMTLIVEDNPQVAWVPNLDPETVPPGEQRKALWVQLMGRQHGTQEDSDGKVAIPPEREGVYRAALGRIALGPHPVMETIPVSPAVNYNQALLNGGTPLENINLLRAGFQPNVQEVVALTGQRVRDMWLNVIGEGSVEDLFATIGTETGVGMEALAARSPFIQAELARTGEGWEAPFATEYHMYRLTVEAYLSNYIDWERYDETVHVQPPIGLNEEMTYLDRDKLVTVPPREEGAVTYHLKDGRKCHVVNGPAVARPNGAPRATSASIAEEAVHYVPVPTGASVVGVAGGLHLRAAVDTIITYFDHAGDGIARADVATAPWVRRSTHIVAAVGELMAMTKADLRLREVLRGGNPNKPELTAI